MVIDYVPEQHWGGQLGQNIIQKDQPFQHWNPSLNGISLYSGIQKGESMGMRHTLIYKLCELPGERLYGSGTEAGTKLTRTHTILHTTSIYNFYLGFHLKDRFWSYRFLQKSPEIFYGRRESTLMSGSRTRKGFLRCFKLKS